MTHKRVISLLVLNMCRQAQQSDEDSWSPGDQGRSYIMEVTWDTSKRKSSDETDLYRVVKLRALIYISTRVWVLRPQKGWSKYAFLMTNSSKKEKKQEICKTT